MLHPSVTDTQWLFTGHLCTSHLQQTAKGKDVAHNGIKTTLNKKNNKKKIKFCDIKAAKPRSVTKTVRRRRSTTAQTVWGAIYRQTGCFSFRVKILNWAGVRFRSNCSCCISVNWNWTMWAPRNQPCRSKAEHRRTVRHDVYQPFILYLTFLYSSITLMNTHDRGDKKERQPPPLISRHRNTIILHSHMLPDHAPCSVSKVNLVTLSPEPLLYIFKAAKSILSVHKGFFFLHKLQSSVSRAKAVSNICFVTAKTL